MKVVILAAGYGTRLYPVTLDLPKPLLGINGKPIVNFIMDKLTGLKKSHQPQQIRLVSNARFYSKFIDWRKAYDYKIELVNDKTTSPENRLGAIKDMRLGFNNEAIDWLVLGGDNLFKAGLAGFLKFALSKRPYPTIGVYDVKSLALARHYGVVKTKKNLIVEFQEKPLRPKSTLAASCIYFFPAQSFGFLDEFIKLDNKADAAGKYIAWLTKRTKVYAYKIPGQWIDVGSQVELKKAEKLFRRIK